MSIILDLTMPYDEILSKGFDGSFFINGLSSYFRDLLISKDNITIQLLEVGDKIKENYKEYANKVDVNFIYKALDITNACDLSYKASQNKRLHVELALIKLCNINNNDLNTEVKKKVSVEVASTPKPAEKLKEQKFIAPKKPVVKEKSTSKAQASVSIKSVLKGETNTSKKEEEEKQDYVKRNEQFTKQKGLNVFKEFVSNLEKTEPRIYSILNKDIIEIKDDNITFEISTTSTTQQTAIEEQRLDIIDYLKDNLENDHIRVNIVTKIAELKQENKLYTQRDKYNFLKEKNSKLEFLREEFNLDFN